jgi:hypothetical protein
MRFMPTILLVLSLPAGALGYALGARLMSALSLPEPAQGLLALFVPLFVGGLFMLPLIVPFFDRMAKRDLAAHGQDPEPDATGSGDEPGGPRV